MHRLTPCAHLVLVSVMLATATCPRLQLPPRTGQLLLEGLAGVNTCFHHLAAPFMVYGRLGVKTGTQHVVYSLQASRIMLIECFEGSSRHQAQLKDSAVLVHGSKLMDCFHQMS